MSERSSLGWLLDRVSIASFYAYFAAFSVYYIADSIPMLRVMQLAGLGVFAIESSRYLREYGVLYLLLLVSCAAYLAKVIAYGAGDLDVLVYLVAGAGMAMVLYRLEPSARIVWAIYGASLAYFGFALARGMHPMLTMTERSYNHISVLGLTFGVLLGILDVKRGRPVGLVAPIVTFLLCLWAMGRGGILAAALLLVGAALLRRQSITPGRLVLAVVGIGGMGSLLVRSHSRVVTDFLVESTWKFSERGFVDPARSNILRTYLGTLDARTLLLGHEESIVYSLRLTLHNSYLLWHYNFGMGVVFLLGLAAVALWRALRFSRAYLLFMLVIMLRAATDTVLLPGPFMDVPFLFLITAVMARARSADFSDTEISPSRELPREQAAAASWA